MAAEYLSNELDEALRRFFVNDRSVADSMLEDRNGALSNLSSRIDCAYLVGLIGPVARREMHLVPKFATNSRTPTSRLLFDENR